MTRPSMEKSYETLVMERKFGKFGEFREFGKFIESDKLLKHE